MFERLKYRLLRWLLDDACARHQSKFCYGCPLYYEDEDYGSPACEINDVTVYARRAWGLESVEDSE